VAGRVFEEPERRRIYLMRHAEAAYVAEDGTPVPDPRAALLTPNGATQAEMHRRLLGDIDFDRAVCSGLVRTRETAEIVLAGRSKPTLEVVPALAEISGGERRDMRQLSRAEMADWLRHVANPWADAAHPEARFLDGERFRDFEARVIPAYRELLADMAWQTLLIVAHGGVNRLILNHVMGLGWQGTVSIEQDACCINIIDVDMRAGDVVRHLVRAVNLTGYNLNKKNIRLTDMERIAQRIADSGRG
jgi:broad specificity phosphatase PhoE